MTMSLTVYPKQFVIAAIKRTGFKPNILKWLASAQHPSSCRTTEPQWTLGDNLVHGYHLGLRGLCKPLPSIWPPESAQPLLSAWFQAAAMDIHMSFGVIRGHRPYSDLIKIPSWTQGAAPPTESTWPETTAQTMDIVTAPSYGRSRPGCQQHQDQDITLRAGLASQISVASSGSWALLHQQGFRWQHRPSTSAWASLPSHLQCSPSPQYTNLSTSLSLPSLYHILVYGSGTLLPETQRDRLPCVLTHVFQFLSWELEREPGIFLDFVVQSV